MDNWNLCDERLPDVQSGEFVYVIVVVRRARHSHGRDFVLPAVYMNQVSLAVDDNAGGLVSSYPDGESIGERSFTGFFERTKHPEFDEYFEPIDATAPDAVIAWQYFPEWRGEKI